MIICSRLICFVSPWREYLEVAKRLEPQDVIVLNILRLSLPVTTDINRVDAWQSFRSEKQFEKNLSQDEWSVSLNALVELRLVDPPKAAGRAEQVSAYGRMFLNACEVA